MVSANAWFFGEDRGGDSAGPMRQGKRAPETGEIWLSSVDEVAQFLGVDQGTRKRWERVARCYPVRVSRYYLDLIKTLGIHHPLAKMVLPHLSEVEPKEGRVRVGSQDDPLAEELHAPVKGLVHRYRDRALLIATTCCASYCRFCTRKRLVGQGVSRLTDEQLDSISTYLKRHPEVREVIVSGGDPLAMPQDELERCLEVLKKVGSVELLRLGTRAPAVLPQTITRARAQRLARFGPLFVLTHFNHPAELTPPAQEALSHLADAGLPLANQTVLLAGVNDHPDTLEDLFRKLLLNRVKPYYLHQCDLTTGAEPFRTPVSKGIKILRTLRGRLSGLALPTFVVDLPGGRGKVPLTHSYLKRGSVSAQASGDAGCDGRFVCIEDPRGGVVDYPDVL